MNCCCSDGDPAVPAVAAPITAPIIMPKRWPRRVASVIQWALPIATLTLIPKCPACVAGYVLLFTGIGLSFSAAAAMRWALIALSIVALGYLLVRAAKRARAFFA